MQKIMHGRAQAKNYAKYIVVEPLNANSYK